MKALWQQFEICIASIDTLKGTLNPGATTEQLAELETALDIKLPDDVKQAYRIHNGQGDDYFIFDHFSLYPVATILEYNAHHRKDKSFRKNLKLFDDSDQIKDCICNYGWIEIGFDGGSGVLMLDLDPGKQGTCGQIFAYYEDGPELLADSFESFLERIVKDLQDGITQWDSSAGGICKKPDDKEKQENTAMQQREKLASKVSKLDLLLQTKPGQEILLTGSIKPDHNTNKHQLYLKGGPVTISGAIPKISPPMANMPPMVKIRIKVGAKRLLGLLAPEYRIISCERLE